MAENTASPEMEAARKSRLEWLQAEIRNAQKATPHFQQRIAEDEFTGGQLKKLFERHPDTIQLMHALVDVDKLYVTTMNTIAAAHFKVLEQFYNTISSPFPVATNLDTCIILFEHGLTRIVQRQAEISRREIKFQTYTKNLYLAAGIPEEPRFPHEHVEVTALKFSYFKLIEMQKILIMRLMILNFSARMTETQKPDAKTKLTAAVDKMMEHTEVTYKKHKEIDCWELKTKQHTKLEEKRTQT